MIVIAIFGWLLIPIGLYILYRNDRVYKLRIKINKMLYNHDIRHMRDTDYISAYESILPKLAEYGIMVLSFKPLKIEAWLSEEDINELNR